MKASYTAGAGGAIDSGIQEVYRTKKKAEPLLRPDTVKIQKEIVISTVKNICTNPKDTKASNKILVSINNG